MQTLDLLLLADGTARSASPEWNRLVGNFHHIAWTAAVAIGQAEFVIEDDGTLVPVGEGS